MNLHGIVRHAIGAVNPDISATLLRSTGYTTEASGKQVPTYASSTGKIQVQAVSGKDLDRINYLGIQGVMRSVYLYGNWQGIVKADQKGGDILNFPQVPGAPVQSWKVINVAETYPDWSRVIVWLQQALITS